MKPLSSGRQCELCRSDADLFCPADAAFLCQACDATVHRANFLVARHVRSPLCRVCGSLTTHLASGESPSISHRGFLCGSCSTSSASSSLDCLSSCESSSSTQKRVPRMRERDVTSVPSMPPNAKADIEAEPETIFLRWCDKLDVDVCRRRAVLACANWALRICHERFRMVRPRMSLAAAFWFGFVACGERTAEAWRNLKIFERVSGVSGGFLRTLVVKIARVAKSWRRDLKEGWDESRA